MELFISPRRIITVLFWVIIALTLSSLGLNLIRIYTGHETIFGLLNLLELDNESNLPAIFSFLLLMTACLLLFMISADHKRCGKLYRHWFWLAVLFCYLSFDEGAMIHEMISEWVRPFVPQSDATIHVWVVPYATLFLIVAFAYFRFWLRLDSDVKWAMAIAGFVYVCGAVGCEMLGSLNYAQYGDNRGLAYTMMSTVEEFLEMMGVLIFLYALLKYIQRNSIAVTIRCRPEITRNPDSPSDNG